ncbi:tapasin [Pelobates cultripes]|uniref:Tapasin n=1 Tax=Pelobates cultripes TaxID=61616 RepID=A0AAD1WME6_PELCU|nr:tapasin [Pelobates cultripes]
MLPSTIYKLLLLTLFGAVSLELFNGADATSISCWLVEEVSGANKPRSIQRTAVHLEMTDPSSLTVKPPVELEKDTLLYYVTDTSGKLMSIKSSYCEMTELLPQEVPLEWVQSLTDEKRSPLSLGGPWFILSVKDKTQDENSLSIVLGPLLGKKDHLTVSLVVYSSSKTMYATLGKPASVPCYIWRGQQSRFAVEWRHRALGDGKVMYAYDGHRDRVVEEFPGCQLNFSALYSHGDASLILDKVEVSHQGTFLCTSFLPYVRGQRDIQLQVTALPRVALKPDPLFTRPGEELTLSCEISHFHPLEIMVEYLVQLPGENHSSPVPGMSLSPHTQNQDGTFSMTAFLHITANAEHHGARYSCRIRHISSPKALTHSQTLKIAGVSGPSLEDGMCLFVVALFLYGALSYLTNKVKSFFRVAEDKKAKSE